MRRIAARILLGLVALLTVSAASAQDYSYHLYVDRDVIATTGCSETVGATQIDGAEIRVTANVTGTTVTTVTSALCAGGVFGAESVIGGPHPVGLNNGTGGADVIEFALDRAQLGVNGVVRVALSGSNGAGTSTDVLTNQPGGDAILVILSQAAIPALGLLGLLLLVGALLFVASRRLKVGLASLGALLMATAVWAANFVVDGAVLDWNGVTAVANDPGGDATGSDPGADVIALFAAEEAGKVFFRVDVTDVENQVPVAVAQALVFAEDSGAQPITLTATDGDGDPLTYALTSNPTQGVLSGFNANTGAVTYTPNLNAEGADSFTFTASDGLATSAPATISITLTPVNDAPVATDAVFSVDENTVNGTNVGTPIVATDVDTTAPNNTLTYSITAGNTSTAFAINASSGQITVANSAALDFKINPSFALTVTVTDGGAGPLSDTAAVTINLGNLNEPPVFQAEPYVFALAENSAVATSVGLTPALDQDTTAPNNTLTWAITSGNGSGAFAINAATGEITVANSAPLNFETTPSFTLGISVTDGGTPQGSDTSSVTINLTDVNEAPVVNAATFTLPENSAITTAVGTVTATDVDVPAQTFTWAITAGNTGGAFTIAANGAITVAATAALDFEVNPTFALTVQATDNGTPNLSGTATVTVNLTNVNEAPVFQAEPYTANVAENTPNGTNVTNVVTATDVDAATTLTYAITGGNTSGAFAIAPTTGAITVANSAALDFKINPSFTLNLSVTDNGAPTLNDTSSITITIGDVNEAPVFQSEPYSFSINENVAPATAVGTTPATDQDLPPQTLTYAITGGNTGGTFAIGAGGAITVAISPDFETTASYALNISVTDNGTGNLSDTSTVTVTINNVNEAPVNTVPIAQTTGVGIPLGLNTANGNAISILDVDAAAGNVTTTVSTTLGTFTASAVNGATVTGSGTNSVQITDIVGDVNVTLQTLSFTSGAGGTADVTVLTNDNGNTGSGGAQFDSDLFQINVDAAPTVTGVTPAAAANVANNQALTVSFSENITTIIGNAVTLSCNGGPDLITGGATGTNVGVLNPTYAGTLPSGPCVLTVIAANVTDADLIDPPNTMAVNFTRNFTVDSAPAVTTTTPANGDGNVAANATITVNFSENVNATLGAFGLDCGAGAITLAPNTITNASTIVMTPGTLLPPTSTCVLTITGANITDSDLADNPDVMVGNTVVSFTTSDPPPTVVSTVPTSAGTLAANADLTITFSEAVSFTGTSFTLVCTPGPVAFPFVVSGSPGTVATLNPTGNLPVGQTCTATVLAGAAGVEDVDVIDPPGNLAVAHVFSFTPVNTPPTLTAGATLNYTENDAATVIDGTITVADPDSPNLASASATISANFAAGEDALACAAPACTAGGIVVGGTAGALTLTGNASLATYQAALRAVTYVNSSNNPSTLARTVTWIGNDGIAASTAVTSTVNVAATDDGPVAVADATTVIEDSAATAINVLANDTDADGGAISITSVTQPANGTVVITGGGTGLTYAPNANYCNNPPGTTLDTFTYTLAPGGSSTTVTATVTCVDDNPTAVADVATVAEDSGANAVPVLTNDTDPDAGPISISSVTQPANGTVVITGGGTGLTYAPNANYCNNPPGTTLDTFTYTLTPGASNATVTMTVTCVDDPPVAVADAATVVEDSGANAVNVLPNDTDPDGGPISVGSVTQPANGVVVITGGGTGLTYQPSLNYCNNPPGTTLDTFTYTLAPGSSSTTVTMTVTCVNDPPVAGADAFDFIGNTELRVDLAAVATPHALEATGLGNGVVNNDSDPVEGNAIAVTSLTVGACTDSSAPLTCSDPAIGTVTLDVTGDFSFVPAPGDIDPTAVFTYQITDNGTPLAASATGTVTLTRFERIWYVSASAGAGNGTSSSPFNVLTNLNGAGGAGDSDLAGDYIFVHNNGTLAGGLELEANQHLLGEGVGLSIPVNLNGNGAPTNLVAAGTRPLWNNGSGNTVSMSCATPIEIRGLSLQSTSGNAIDETCAAALTGSATLTISNNDIRGASAEGVDINLNAGSTGALTLAFNNNTWIAGTHTGNAFDLVNANTVTLGVGFNDNVGLVSTAGAVSINDSLPAGVTTITGFANNTVSGNTGGFGLFVNNATFDSTAGGAFNVVSGGNTQVGASGNGVGSNGVILTSVTGDLSFTNLDVFNDAGVGLRATSAGAFNAAGGVGFRLAAALGTGSVTSVGGPVIDFDSATIDLQNATVVGSGSATQGIRFNSALGTFSAVAGSSITTGAGATNFLVNGSVMTSSYAGILNATAGTGVNLTSNTGSTLNFTGTTTMSTGTNTAFNATGGGTISVTGAANTLTTTTATALNVANTTIAASGLNFRSISANGAANGIVLNTTGASGGLTVTGTGAAGTGGTIQNISGRGASFTSASNVSLTQMNITNTATAAGAPCGSAAVAGANTGCNAAIHLDTVNNVTLSGLSIATSGQQGINGIGVTNFTLSNSALSSLGNGPDEDGLHFHNMLGTNAITNTTVTGSGDDNVNIQNLSAIASTINISGSSFNAGVQGSGLLFGIRSTANTTINIANVTVDNNFSGGIVADSFDTATMRIDVTGVVDQNNNDGVQVSAHNGSGQYDIHDNLAGTSLIGNNDFVAVTILKSAFSNAGTLEGQINNTEVIIPDNRPADGLFVFSAGGSSVKSLITNNSIVYRGTQRAVMVQGGQDGAAIMETTVTGNNIDMQLDGTNDANSGIQSNLIIATPTGNGSTMCADIGGGVGTRNVFTHSLGGVMPGGDIRVRQRNGGPLRMPNYAGAAGDAPAVITYLSGRNTVLSAPTATTTDNLFSGGVAPCLQPVIP